MTKVVINEQHKLLPEQEQILNERFGNDGWEVYPVPADGWTLAEQREKMDELMTADVVVFVSPVPYLLKELAYQQGAKSSEAIFAEHRLSYGKPKVLVFHNDKRVKKELPDGRIISVVASDGWVLV